MMKKFQEFQKAHDDAIITINSFLQPSKYEPDMSPLVKWMMETDANPYSYLPEGWANSLSTATGFAGLLHHISHALYDDGEITFVKVNGEPRITFVWRHEDNFRNYVLSEQEKQFEERFGDGDRYDIEVLDIKPAEFGPLYDAYQRDWIKQCFINDASRGIEWAAECYRKYQCWDDAWIEEARKEYED
jgi:hypothetical protein